ncbi:MAG: pyridoxal-phosphate dependent enzyme [Nitrososphaerales archaeon]
MNKVNLGVQKTTTPASAEYARVKSYIERIGAPFFDLENKKSVNITPVANITRLVEEYLGSKSSNVFYLKEEYKNPLTLSVKGRAVASMVLNGVKSGLIYSDSGDKKKWIEPTSGNTGKGLAEIAKLLNVEFTAVFSRLDVSEDIKAELVRFGAGIVTIGAEYSLPDLESFAKRHGKSVVYYWTTPRKISPESLALFNNRLDGSSVLLKEIDPKYLVDHIIGPAAEALRAPLIARVQKGEFGELKKNITSYIPELNDPDTIVAFLCPLGNTSMAINTLLSQLGFDNVCNVKGGIGSLRRKDDLSSSEYCPLPGAAISSSSIDFVKQLVKDNPSEYFTFMQYENEENVRAHVLTTGPELTLQVPGLSKVICTFGTGGTATGLAEYFNGNGVSVYVTFPEQPVEGIRTLRGAEGLAFYRPEMYAGVLKVDNSKAYELLKFFVQHGVKIGPSTAIALQAVLDLPLNKETCAVIAADGIENYRAEYSSTLNF